MTDERRRRTNSHDSQSHEDLARARRRRARMRRRRRQRAIRAALLLVISIILVITGCVIAFKLHSSSKEKKLEAQQQAMAEQQQAYLDGLTAEQNTRAENKIHIVAVGDNVIHERIYESGIDDNGKYSYDHLYTHIKEDIEAADIAIVNQESIFVEDHEDVSAYPEFGSPVEIGDALVEAGFDVVEHASNHTFDKGTSAISDTLSYWKTNHPDIKVLGIHDSQESADTITTITCKGVTFSLLNYTSMLNGDEEKDFPAYMIDMLTQDKIAEDAEKAKEAGDITIALLHIGTEYADTPSAEQKEYLNFLLSAGVDITICSHPHVLQNFETLKDENGNEMLVYYSLGNFISTQKDPDCLLGGMADITLTKDTETGEFSVTDASLVPLVTHYDYDENEYTVYKLEDYTEELAAKHSIHKESEETFTLEWLNAKYKTTLKRNYNTLDN